MEEVVYRHALLDRARLRPLEGRSDRLGRIPLAGHFGSLAGTGTLLWLALGTWWAVPATLLHGAVLIFLFTPLHECIHRTAFRSRLLNDTVAWVAGALIVLPPEYFR